MGSGLGPFVRGANAGRLRGLTRQVCEILKMPSIGGLDSVSAEGLVLALKGSPSARRDLEKRMERHKARSIQTLGRVVALTYAVRCIEVLVPTNLLVNIDVGQNPWVRILWGLGVMSVGAGLLAIVYISGLLFLIWSHIARENVARLLPEHKFEYAPWRMTIAYFIPVIHLVWPYTAMREVLEVTWLAAHPDGGEPRHLARLRSLLGLWWFVHILALLADRLYGSAGATLGFTGEGLDATLWPLTIVAGVCNVLWCLKLSALQDRAIARQVSQTP